MKKYYDFMTAKNGETKKWNHSSLTQLEIIEELSESRHSLVDFEAYHDMAHKEQAKIKIANPAFIGGLWEGKKRSIQTMISRNMVVLDVDFAFKHELKNFLIKRSPYSFYIYDTMSSTPKLRKYRVLFFLDEDLKADYYEPFARRLASDLGIIDIVDKTCYRKNQLMYWPSFLHNAPCQTNEWVELDEPQINVDEMLERFADITDPDSWDAAKDEGRLGKASEIQLADPREKDNFIGHFCKFVDGIEQAIEMFDLPYKHEHGDRWSYTRGESVNGFIIYDDGQHCYSNHESDPAGNRHSLNAFDLVRIHLFGDLDKKEQYADPTRAPSYKALLERVEGDERFKQIQVEANRAKIEYFEDTADEDFAEFTADPEHEDGDEDFELEDFAKYFDDEPETRQRRKKARKKKARAKKSKLKQVRINGKMEPYDPLATDEQKQDFENFFLLGKQIERGEKGAPKSTTANLQATLFYNAAFKGRIRLDEFKRQITFTGRKFWVRDSDEQWGDADTIGLRVFLEKNFGMKYSKQEMDDVVLLAATNNKYNSLQEFFTYDLPEWDGTERVATMFHDCLGADDSEVNALIAQKTLLGALERALNPGKSKVQTVTVLQGSQGIKKSTFWEKLCPNEDWFTDSKINIGHKDGYSVLGGNFIIELAEFASVKKADRDDVKNFISSSQDTYRPSFARYDQTFNRHNIFVGSVNDEQFLTDPTGNRRFKVVACAGGVELYDTMNNDYVMQLWAEAMQLRADGALHWYDTKEEAETEAVAREHVVEGSLDALVQLAALSKKPKGWWALDPMDQRTILDEILAGTYDIKELTEEPLERFTVTDISKQLGITENADKVAWKIGQALMKIATLEKARWQIQGVRVRGYKIL